MHPHYRVFFIIMHRFNPRVKSMHNDKKDTIMWMHNTRLRSDLYKEIKKPGRSMY
jgi:hypothetical protein